MQIFSSSTGIDLDPYLPITGVSKNLNTITDGIFTRNIGSKFYELSDHLGNVRSVVSDGKIVSLSSGDPINFMPEILSFNNYYAFGMIQPERNYDSGAYRYGFQGQEKDDEIKGTGNSINYMYRMHDPRIGRFFSVDPLTASYPQWSPYQFSGNQVISTIELEGLEPAEDLNEPRNNPATPKISDIGTATGITDPSLAPASSSFIRYNSRETPKGPYLSIQGDLSIGAHTRETELLLGLGAKTEVGLKQEIVGLEFVLSGEGAYLNIDLVSKQPEATVDVFGATVGAGTSMTIPLNPYSSDDPSVSANFSAGPFLFNIPMSEESPTMEISIFEQGGNIGEYYSAGWSVSIKNIQIMDTKDVTKSYQQSHNQILNHPFFQHLRE